MTKWIEGKTFPVVGTGMTIPWSVAEEAYLGYNPRGNYSQTLLRLAERGGFHVSELDDYVPDWREKASEITALRSENAALKAQLTEVERDRDMMQACLSTPELYVGVVTEACESHWAGLIKEARSELKAAKRDCDIRDAQLAGLKAELAEIRKAANRLCSTSIWQKRTMPSGAIHYDVVVDNEAYRNFVSVLEADTPPSTPEGE